MIDSIVGFFVAVMVSGLIYIFAHGEFKRCIAVRPCHKLLPNRFPKRVHTHTDAQSAASVHSHKAQTCRPAILDDLTFE